MIRLFFSVVMTVLFWFGTAKIASAAPNWICTIMDGGIGVCPDCKLCFAVESSTSLLWAIKVFEEEGFFLCGASGVMTQQDEKLFSVEITLVEALELNEETLLIIGSSTVAVNLDAPLVLTDVIGQFDEDDDCIP